jgi:diacylglycerol kinase family enzyme
MRTPFVFVGNNEYRLDGLRFGARNTLSRGHLHVCTAPEMTRMEVAGVLMSSLAGRLHQFEHFDSFCATELSIDARRQHVAVSVDGELAVFTTPIRLRTLPAALRVLVPPASAID